MVEDDLEAYANRLSRLAEDAKRAPDDETKQRIEGLRNVLLTDAEGLIARTPRALKAKAKMLIDEDWIQTPTSSGAGFVRSLLRDILQQDG